MRVILNILFIFVFILSTPTLLAGVNEESGHEDHKSYLLFDEIYLQSVKKEAWNQRPKSYVNAIYPVLSDAGDNETVARFNELIADFIKSERADFKADINSNSETQKTLPPSLRKNTLYIDYASAFVRAKKSRVLSVRFSIQRYIGGMAHPERRHYTLNYDLSNGSVIELSSLFKDDSHYLEVLSGIINDSLAKKLKTQFIAEGVKATEDNFDHWNLKSDGILFTFDEGQVAPRVYGAQTVLVPYRSIPGLLSEDTVIAHCVNRKSRCLASNLLTGGFLDEAALSTTSRRTAERSAV